MLDHTFIHVPGIGEKTECRLWKGGIRTWNQFLNHPQVIFSPAKDEMVRRTLHRSKRNRGNIHFFKDLLPSREYWRLYRDFRDLRVFLDIETGGGDYEVDEITVAGIYDGRRVRTFVSGINLDRLEEAIAPYEMVITFNGASFDLPVLRRAFPQISLPPVHIDLRFVLNRLGYRGGLKKIEHQFGLQRSAEVRGLDGYDAVLLWRRYQQGDRRALDRLVAYNTADIVSLQPLMEAGYRELESGLLSGR